MPGNNGMLLAQPWSERHGNSTHTVESIEWVFLHSNLTTVEVGMLRCVCTSTFCFSLSFSVCDGTFPNGFFGRHVLL